MNDYYSQLASAIISKQEELIGAIAWEQASRVDGLQTENNTVQIVSSNPGAVIDDLVSQYSVIFGPAAVEVSREAASRVAPRPAVELLPALLK